MNEGFRKLLRRFGRTFQDAAVRREAIATMMHLWERSDSHKRAQVRKLMEGRCARYEAANRK